MFVKACLLFALSRVGTAAFFGWQSAPASNDEADQSVMGNMLNSLFSDLNLDISFAPNMAMGTDPADAIDDDDVSDEQQDVDSDYYYLGASPSSMIRFPSFSSFASNTVDRMRSMRSPFAFSREQPQPDGLYLMVQSPDVHPKASAYQLTQTQQVNGDTYRYAVRSSGDAGGERPLIHSWSTQKMYLCNNADCKTSTQMVNVMDEEDDDHDAGYMHLVPLSSLEPLATDFDPEEFLQYLNDVDGVGDDEAEGLMAQLSSLMFTAKNSFGSFLNYFMGEGSDDYGAYYDEEGDDINVDVEADGDDADWFDMSFGGLLNSVLYDDASSADPVYDEVADFGDELGYEYEDEYGYDEDEMLNTMVPDDLNEMDYVYEEEQMLPKTEAVQADEELEFAVNNDRLLVDEGVSSQNNDKIRYLNHGFLLVEMTIIIVLIMICGVCYSGYKWLLSRRERRRENDYYNVNMNAALLGK